MGTRDVVTLAIGLVCAAGIAGCRRGLQERSLEDLPQAESTAEASRVEWALRLTGEGLARPTTFTFEQLSRMPMTRLDNVLWQKTHAHDELTSWQGPSLESLLAAAQVKPGPMTMIFEAADGYEVECTREEMDSAVIALQNGEGRWLSEINPECPIRLIPPHKPGNYWVMNVRTIKVVPGGSS